MSRHVARKLVGSTTALVGSAVVLIEVARYELQNRAITPVPVILGLIFAVFGAYILDPKTTKGGTGWIATLGERAVNIVAIWKRRDGNVVAVTEEGAVVPMPPGTAPSIPAVPTATPSIELPPPSPPSKGDER